MEKVKITVLKRTVSEDIVNQVIDEEHRDMDRFVCDRFEDGQEFVVDVLFDPPEGFCPWAWSDILKLIMHIGGGGSFQPPYSQEGTIVGCCTDGLRPVIFKIERID